MSLKERERQFIETLRKEVPNVVYVGGYKTQKQNLTVKCKRCGRRRVTTGATLIKGGQSYRCLSCSEESQRILKKDLKVLSLWRKGHSQREIAEITGYNRSQVRISQHSLGITISNDETKKYGADLEGRTKLFLKRLSKYFPNFKYCGGYENKDSLINLQCNKCGNKTVVASRYILSGEAKRDCAQCQEEANKEKAEEAIMQELNNIFLKSEQELERNISELEEHYLREIRQDVMHACYCSCGELVWRKYKVKNPTCIDCQNAREQTASNAKKEERIKEARNNGHYDYSITLEALIERDNNICHLCHKECSLDKGEWRNGVFITHRLYPSIDHVIPISKGGTHTWENVKLAHVGCNAKKGNALMNKEVLHNRQKQEASQQT